MISMSARSILISVTRNKSVRTMTEATIANVKMDSTNFQMVFVWTLMNVQLALIHVSRNQFASTITGALAVTAFKATKETIVVISTSARPKLISVMRDKSVQTMTEATFAAV